MATAKPNVQYLPVDEIEPSPDNPRIAAGGDLGDLTELTELIRAQGVLQNLVVCPKSDGRYPLAFGARRLAAAKQAGLTEVPAEIRDYTEAERFAAMYGENFGREGLTPLQEAFAYQLALDRKGADDKKLFTQRSLAQRLGVGLAKYPARVEAALGDFHEHRDVDMETAVRKQQADLEREAKVAQTLKELKAARVRIAPDDWRDQGAKRLGDGFHELDMAVEDHASEPCHHAMVTHHGDVAYVCIEPDRHRPAEEPVLAADPSREVAAAEPTAGAPA